MGNHIMERQCIVHGHIKPCREMIRFVCAPNGTLTPDIKSRLPGRGVWVSASYKDISYALDHKKSLRRAFKKDIKIDENLADRIGTLLKQYALGYLSFAQSAGVVRNGFGKVHNAIKMKRAKVIVNACDGSAQQRNKLNAYAAHLKCKIIESFPMHEISMALGHKNVIHVAMEKARITEKFIEATQKYNNYVASYLLEDADDDQTISIA